MPKKKSKSKKIQFMALGGLEEIGKNLYVYEYRDQIILIDCGLKFPGPTLPGIDLIVGDLSYLESNKDKILGLFITHGHLDHIGGLPYLLKRLNLTVYATPFARLLIQKITSEKCPRVKFKLKTVDVKKKIRIGDFVMDPFRVNHSIADSVGYAINTPAGTIIHTGDYKIDKNPKYEEQTDLKKLRKYGEQGVLALMSDSTNSTVHGYSNNESDLVKDLDWVFGQTTGRLLIASFSSQIYRIKELCQLAKKHQKRIAVTGRSMQDNIALAFELGILDDASVFIELSGIKKVQKKNIVIITTGTQGEEASALSLMAKDKHRQLKLQPGDTVLMSSSVIPGNERAVNQVLNALYKKEVRVLTNKDVQIHTTGHGYADELKMILSVTKPQFFVPVHGEAMHLYTHRNIAEKTGIPRNQIIILENGKKIELSNSGSRIITQLNLKYPLIEYERDNQVTDDILSERTAMANGGTLSITILYTPLELEQVHLYSKGFVNKNILQPIFYKCEEQIRKSLKNSPEEILNDSRKAELKIKRDLKNITMRETGKNPLVVLHFIRK